MARDSIQDLFPNIPEQDLYQIIKTAFQKGQKKVGTANELSQIRRAQLSVVAHIRHVYTDYDRLLRTVGYRPARHRVEKDTLKKLVEWRGDDETGKNSLEQVIEDVIVLSDDDDTANDIDFSAHQQLSARSPIVTTQILDPQDLDNSGLEDDRNGRHHYVPQPATRRRLVDDHFDDEILHRQRRGRWEMARDEHRQNPTSLKPIIGLDDSLRSMDLRQPLKFHDYSLRGRVERFPNHAVHERHHYTSQVGGAELGENTDVRGLSGVGIADCDRFRNHTIVVLPR